MILWTRRPPTAESKATKLIVEIADDSNFHRIVATGKANLSADADWTCRILAVNLKPRRVYWYRFMDEHGFGSRVGRTITAPSANDSRPTSFAFVSCANHTMGANNAYRRMIWEDERAAPHDQPSYRGFFRHCFK